MRLVILTFFIALSCVAITSGMEIPKIEPGISKSLAVWRAAHYSDVHYKIDLKLAKMAPSLKGSIEITVSVRNKATEAKRKAGDELSIPIILDWRKIAGHESVSKISNATLNGRPAKPDEFNEHLIFRIGTKDGVNTIKIDFESPILKSGGAITRYIDNEDASEYIYSLFVPSDASTAIPLFDQPDLKARFTLTAEAPKNWSVVANSPLYSQKNSRETNALGFEETKPISTYVFAFAAGPFKAVQKTFPKEHHGFGPAGNISPEQEVLYEHPKGLIYVRKSQFEKFKPHAKEVIRLNRESIKYFEKYFDYKFPFPKYDIVLIPEFPFGGMEHAGATFLREHSVIFPTEPTANNYIARASVIFHEAAHQWFGDTVTMEWFDDLWLKEGFATFMANKAMTEVLPEYDAWKVFYQRTKPGAYATDVTKGTTPIFQEIPNLNSAKSAYGNIVYQKAPSFLKQAEFYLGEKEFQDAVRLFLRHHAYSNADWSMLVAAFEATSKQDLSDWADAWVKTRGLPIVRLKRSSFHSYQKLGEPHDTADIYSLVQEDALGEGGVWPLKTKVLLRFENGSQEIKEVDLTKQDNKTGFGKYWVDIQSNPNFRSQAPVFVFPNFDDKAYGIFLLDSRSQKYALENIQNEKDSFLRSMMWGALWDSVRFAELDPLEYIELAIKNISVERDVTTVSSILGRVETAYTYYLTDERQADIGPRLEELIWTQMTNAQTNGELLTYYSSYLSTAQSDESKTFLKSLVPAATEGDGRLGRLLRTRDRFDIATRLIELGDPEGRKILATLKKNETDDAAKRYAFAAGAGFPSASVKKKYFEDFVNNKELQESWIEAAFAVWNSPAHQDLTLPYLEQALNELPNLKRDRKIFFVNGWLASFIGGQKSAEALDKVKLFLNEHPNLDPDLKRKVLERVDGLARSVKIREKYSTD